MMGLLSDAEVGLAAPTAAPGPRLSTRDAMTKVALEAPLTPLDPYEAESQHPQYGPDIADLKSEIVKNKNNPKKLSMLQEHLDNVQPKGKSGLLSDFDVGLTKLDPNGPV